ncbi:MAG: TetR/AcrR family transcriptional regulator [Saprospiraceae bacterium]|nr:TetR/AcrR family transcriptional regulator [Saprospiraceae bacterium]
MSMDDIARDAGISKKTLYQYVESKEELVRRLVRQYINNEQCMMIQIKSEAQNALVEMLKTAEFVTALFKKLNPRLLYELKKYYHESWKEVNDMHRHHIISAIQNNIERGIEEGVYNKDVDPPIVARLYVNNALLIIDDDVFSAEEFQREQIYHQFIRYHLRGIMSSFGLQKLSEYMATKGKTNII